MVTGQVILRKAGVQKNGKELYMIVGIIGLEHDAVINTDHQYTLVGREFPDSITMQVMMNGAVDRTEEARGLGLGHLVTLPIWKL